MVDNEETVSKLTHDRKMAAMEDALNSALFHIETLAIHLESSSLIEDQASEDIGHAKYFLDKNRVGNMSGKPA